MWRDSADVSRVDACVMFTKEKEALKCEGDYGMLRVQAGRRITNSKPLGRTGQKHQRTTYTPQPVTTIIHLAFYAQALIFSGGAGPPVVGRPIKILK